jgi:hypothetical protein
MWKLALCVISWHIGFSDGLLGIGSSQSVDVQGILTCNGQPASGILVKLYDSNSKCCYTWVGIRAAAEL